MMIRVISLFFLSALLLSCVAHNLPPKQYGVKLSDYYCQNNTNSKNTDLTVENLYSEMKTCIITEDYSSAVLLFSAAGSLSWYQAANNDNDVARNKHKSLLSTYLSGIEQLKREKFWLNTHSILGAENNLRQICQKLSELSSQLNDNNSNISENESWNSALVNYLHCPILSE